MSSNKSIFSNNFIYECRFSCIWFSNKANFNFLNREVELYTNARTELDKSSNYIQKTIEEILCEKSKIAFKEFKKNNKTSKNIFVIAGGVASNKNIRQKLTDLSLKEKYNPIFPPINLCSDNAAMIAMVGLEKYKLGIKNKMNFPAKPRWPLDEKAAFLKGAGVKL